jgi:tetratricopeptide (TPR) repeat protein
MRRWLLSRAAQAALFVAVLSGTAAAQGRVSGVVRDEGGAPIKAATVTADNSDIGLNFTATTDDKGRFSMIGLRPGPWRFAAMAPGFFPQSGQLSVRTNSAQNPALLFSLTRSSPVAYGALAGLTAKDLQADLKQAETLFESGKWDDAIAAYRAIAAKSPVLGVVNLQIAAALRQKQDLDGAMAIYTGLLKGDPANEGAAIGLLAVALERNQPERAEAPLVKAAEEPTAGRQVLYALGELKFERKDCENAAAWYQKASTADLSWGKPLYKLGVCAGLRGDTAAEAAFMRKVVDVDPESPEAAQATLALDAQKK